MSKLIHDQTFIFNDMNQLLLTLLDTEKAAKENKNVFLESEIMINKTNYTLRIKIFKA